jgi:MFS family permease
VTSVAGTPTATQPTGTAAMQRRTLAVLAGTQVVGGVGVAIGISVGALLTARLGGTAVSGLGQSALVIGAAVLVVPVTRLMRSRGRRPGLVLAYLIGAFGAATVVAGASRGSVGPVVVGLFLFGGANTANYQARYAAVDLAEPARRARQLSLVVWATTVGAVAGPNLSGAADRLGGWLGTARLSGPFLVSAMAFLAAGTAIAVLLRPDPLLVLRSGLRSAPGPAHPDGGFGPARGCGRRCGRWPVRRRPGSAWPPPRSVISS